MLIVSSFCSGFLEHYTSKFVMISIRLSKSSHLAPVGATSFLEIRCLSPPKLHH